jgi:hypothetical protein
MAGVGVFPLALVIAFCRDVVRARVVTSSLCIVGSYPWGKTTREDIAPAMLGAVLVVACSTDLLPVTSFGRAVWSESWRSLLSTAHYESNDPPCATEYLKRMDMEIRIKRLFGSLTA